MRQYIVVKADQRFLKDLGDYVVTRNHVFGVLRELGASSSLIEALKGVEVVGTPSADYRPASKDDAGAEGERSELVISLSFPDRETIERLREFVAAHLGDLQEDAEILLNDKHKQIIRNIGADPSVQLCDFIPCVQGGAFGNRSRAHALMRTKALGERKGRGVNVVIVDQGLNRLELEKAHPGCWGGDLIPATITNRTAGREVTLPLAGSAPVNSHGMLIARNVLDIAPQATLYDIPLLPGRIGRPNVFAGRAHAALKAAIESIVQRRDRSGVSEPWVIVNAWAVFDRSEEVPEGDYTLDSHRTKVKTAPGRHSWERGHPLNRMMVLAADAGIDMIFSAGNCGLFTTDMRCGKFDRGEGRSILGANAHEAVLTIGAISTSEKWLGYSSQGPAPWGDGARRKPDVCVPSHFYEDRDATRINSGTSAATGLAAGVVAAIRQQFGPKDLSPRDLTAAINASARGQGGVWNARTGHGMLDVERLLARLSGG